MEKVILSVALLFTILCTGCLGKKTANGNGFYSTNSPSLTVKFNKDVQFIGDKRNREGVSSTQSYFYASTNPDDSLKEAAWVEFLTVKSGCFLYPKHLPGGRSPRSAIFTKDIDGDQYYCRIFITEPNPKGFIENYFTQQGRKLPQYSTLRVCNKLISESKKMTLGYADNTDPGTAKKLFGNNYNITRRLNQDQIDFFESFDKKADKAISLKRFEETDLP